MKNQTAMVAIECRPDGVQVAARYVDGVRGSIVCVQSDGEGVGFERAEVEFFRANPAQFFETHGL